MSGTLLVRGARQLITLRGPAEPRRGAALQELGIIRDGALLIEDGRIVEVGLSRRVENLALVKRAQEIDATGRVVMPGFVDCHARLVGGVQSLDDYEACLAGAAPESRFSVPGLRNVSARRLEARARQHVNAMIRHGTTTLEAKSGYGLDARSELKILRVHARLDRAPLDIVSTFLAARGATAAHAGDPASYLSGYLSWVRAELLPAIRRKSLARFAGLAGGEGAFGEELCRGYLETARGLGFQLKIHAGQTAAGDAVRLAVEAGAVSVDGLRDASPIDVDLLARSNTMAVLLPGDAGCAPARQLIDGGAAVALGTDFDPGASSTCSMQAIIALACAQLGMRPAEAICAATFNAACAIGSGQAAGSLEAGKSADLIVLNARDYREIPYRFGVNLVARTVKRGVTVYQEGKVAGRD